MSPAVSSEARLESVREHTAAEFDSYEVDGVCFIVTPYLRPDNDAVTLRIDELGGGRLIVADCRDTIDYLRMSGYGVRGDAQFQEDLHRLTESLGVRVEHEEIFAETDEARLAETIISVARAAQHVSYLIYRHRARVE